MSIASLGCLIRVRVLGYRFAGIAGRLWCAVSAFVVDSKSKGLIYLAFQGILYLQTC